MESKGAKMISTIYDYFVRGKEIPPIKHWELVAISNTAGVWKNDKTKSYVYAYRGAITPEDFAVVPALMTNKVSTTARYNRDKEFTKKHQPPEGYYRFAVGHSLGGAMVDQILADNLADKGISYNPAIELSKLKNSKNTRLYNSHDFLYKIIGMHASNVKITNTHWFDQITQPIRFFDIIKSYYEHNEKQFIDEKSESEPSKDYIIQSVHLSKKHFEDIEHAKKWIAEHHYKQTTPEETPNEYRFPQLSTKLMETGHYRAKSVKIGDAGYLIVLYK
jgi:hypothetical protein